ncbi:ribosomal protein S5 domain 2-type protein [Baffinella frigidus]|nr:ribosomal protein S5 domain 2-type protein [Cryptophyta sp. CCMP2293]
MADAVRAILPSHYLHTFIDEGIRPDARAFMESRTTSLRRGVVSRADGSASVDLGKTSVVAGVTLVPFTTTLSERGDGRLSVKVDMAACDPQGPASGRESEAALALTSLVSKTLMGAGILPLERLIVKQGVAAWEVKLSVFFLNDGGNAADAALLAAVAALADTSIPPAELDETGAVVETSGEATAMPLTGTPISLSFAILTRKDGVQQLLVDPSAEEEAVCRSSLSVVLVVPAEGGSAEARCGAAPLMLHKPGGAPVPQKLVTEAIAVARKRAARLLTLLEQS